MKLKISPIFLLLTVAIRTVNIHACENKPGYIYDASDKLKNNTSWVLNFSTKNFTLQSRKYANINDNSSEIGGNLEDCGNALYFCITHPINIVIPKNLDENGWEYEGVVCKTKNKANSDIFTIYCGTQYELSEVIEYSTMRGVISFGSSDPQREVKYNLRGYCGMFSNEH